MRITALSVLRVETSGSGQAKAKPDMRRRQRTPPTPPSCWERTPAAHGPGADSSASRSAYQRWTTTTFWA